MFPALLVCIYFGLFLTSANADCSLTDYALEFPNKDGNDYVHIWGMPSLSQFTVCFWMKSNDSEQGTPLSYAATEQSTNELMIIGYNNFDVWIGSSSRDLSVSANDGEWHHICTSWENTDGSLQFYKDGILAASGTNFKVGHVIGSGGSLVLGQDQDSLAGGFETQQSFQGLLTNVNVWDYVLCPKVIARMSNACLSAWVGNVYRWSQFQPGIKGEPKLVIPCPCSPSGD